MDIGSDVSLGRRARDGSRGAGNVREADLCISIFIVISISRKGG
jgi:hypothetical protein